MVSSFDGAPSRNRTGTPAIHEAADFKSAVSTNFTIGAERLCRHLVLAEFNSQTVANGLSSGGEVRQCSKRDMNA